MSLLAPPWVRFPTIQTMEKYGLDVYSWAELGQSQGWVCAVCGNRPKTGRFVIDHRHVKGFKAMSATEKRRYVRGLCDSYCNRYRVAKLSLRTAEQVVEYLRRHEQKMTSNGPGTVAHATGERKGG